MFDSELYAELVIVLQEFAGVTLGGGETLSELRDIYEEQFGEEY
jgi:hypothetical protein